MKVALLAAPLMTALIGSGVQQSAFANTFDPQQHYQIQQRLEERKTAQCREMWAKAQYAEAPFDGMRRYFLDVKNKKIHELTVIGSYCRHSFAGFQNHIQKSYFIMEKITIEGKELVRYRTGGSRTSREVLGIERSSESFVEDVR